MMDQKLLTPRGCVEAGIIQEVNRQFLHPRGLALAMHRDDAGVETLRMLDARADPEGYVFVDITKRDLEQADRVEQLLREKVAERERRFGWVVQPLVVGKVD